MRFLARVHLGDYESLIQENIRRFITMNTAIPKCITVVVMVSLLVAISIWNAQPAQAADLHVKGAAGSVPTRALSVIASGAVEDTLKACMDRIPKESSIGQRMLAEQTCAGEDETRKVIRSAPKF
jgi:hypothetical protein